MTVLLAYAGWAAAPLVAYAALSHGLRRAPRGFAVLFALYTALAWVTWAALGAQAAATVAPSAVIVPWAGVAVLSLLLYALGAWIGGGE
ncbi:hypothetical protein [Rhodovulum marinum]|uniref:Uncharacterized protein n=1 Tax=Rhodovulum marinum TaxID=320662 RepID=A0A4R2Q5N5_9RHOB|nr:hypothetical protein [Rhodovulum marinum]TCP43128.1 hypothetical protein EV662_102321 [Rhodovulum marinum]